MKKHQFSSIFVAIAFSVLIGGYQMALGATTDTISFSDVPESHPNFRAITALAGAGIIQGYEDGTFKPEKLVNRAEALKIILLSAGKEVDKGLYVTGYSDVPLDSWFSGYVMGATLEGIVGGNPDGTFAPDRTVNKAEYLKMTLLSFGTDLSQHTNLKSAVSADTKVSDWYTPYLSYAKTIGLIYADYKNYLYPGTELNRGQCAEITYKMLLIINGGEAQKLLSMTEAKVIEAIIAYYNNNLLLAVNLAEDALDLSERAVAVRPDSVVLKATNTYTQGYVKVFLAHRLNMQGSLAEAQAMAREANTLANQAIKESGTVTEFAQRIIKIADPLLAENG